MSDAHPHSFARGTCPADARESAAVTGRGLPAEFRPRTVPALLARRAREHPDAPAVAARYRGEFAGFSFAELDQRSTQLAAALTAAGIATPGRPVAWMFGNDAGGEALLTYHAVLKSGAVNVPLNPRLAVAEVGSLLDHCRAEQVITSGEHAARAEQLGAGVGVHRVDDLLANGAPAGPLPEPAEDDLASILYTSGTTGTPKGVEHTHASSLAAGIAWADCFRLTRRDVLQSPFPVVSGAGLHFNAMSCLWAGATVVIDEPRLPDCLERIERFGATVYVAVPSVYQYWLADRHLEQHDLSSLRILDYGGSSMAPAVIARLSERIPRVSFMQTYGFTEAGPGGTYLPEEFTADRPGSIGYRAAGRGSEVRVVDNSGAQVTAGEPGELLFRGPSVMRGYHRDPQATAAVLADGWVRSGDIVSYDDEGFLYFVDRKRELIVRGGYNIAPVEIERVLLTDPDVVEAAVFGVPHADLGEVPMAAVVTRSGSADAGDRLRLLCRRSLADFKVPRSIVLLDRLPKNDTGKVVKSELRRRYGSVDGHEPPESPRRRA